MERAKMIRLFILVLIISLGALIWTFSGFKNDFQLGIGLLMAILTGLWLISLVIKDASIIDVFWGSGFVIIAWFYAFQFSQNGEKTALVKTFVFFTLGSLIKVTYLINPIAFIVYFVYLQIFQKQAVGALRYNASIFKWGAINLLLVLSWNAYMLYYNKQYDSHSFNTTALPIWELNNHNIALTWDYMMNFWYSSYFAHSSFHFLLILFIFQIIYIKTLNIIINWNKEKMKIMIIIIFFNN